MKILSKLGKRSRVTTAYSLGWRAGVRIGVVRGRFARDEAAYARENGPLAQVKAWWLESWLHSVPRVYAVYAVGMKVGKTIHSNYGRGFKAGKAEAYAELSSSLTAIVGEYDRAKAEVVGLSGVERAEAILAAGEATARAAASVGVHRPDRLAESAMRALRSGMHR